MKAKLPVALAKCWKAQKNVFFYIHFKKIKINKQDSSEKRSIRTSQMRYFQMAYREMIIRMCGGINYWKNSQIWMNVNMK